MYEYGREAKCDLVKQKESCANPGPKGVSDMVVKSFQKLKFYVNMTFCYKVMLNYLHEKTIRYKVNYIQYLDVSTNGIFPTSDSFSFIRSIENIKTFIARSIC